MLRNERGEKMSKIKRWWKRLFGYTNVQLKWSSYEEWRKDYLLSGGDARGHAYPMVKAAWYASREIKKKKNQ